MLLTGTGQSDTITINVVGFDAQATGAAMTGGWVARWTISTAAGFAQWQNTLSGVVKTANEGAPIIASFQRGDDPIGNALVAVKAE